MYIQLHHSFCARNPTYQLKAGKFQEAKQACEENFVVKQAKPEQIGKLSYKTSRGSQPVNIFRLSQEWRNHQQ